MSIKRKSTKDSECVLRREYSGCGQLEGRENSLLCPQDGQSPGGRNILISQMLNKELLMESCSELESLVFHHRNSQESQE